MGRDNFEVERRPIVKYRDYLLGGSKTWTMEVERVLVGSGR